ncbi:MAG: helix-turn-helix domain-containing protein [Erysipelotrichaceae bacterium]|nr:helix-turn-helix domain-containing protein [Erysipelotrichaceae bacterium]MBQ3962931.1 helix-turn-helix domain-containing protein [Erysipelotrichaceae bacterium]MBQ4020796.1 helix-turn-helix domain-containing protein [Erysipelotrichaceae bacterium]MBQ5553413.1 helix-turn-helix domain-containing protein [Erysipelotrichaceae bacterium]MBQ6216105.1 helix-turn-helix domain-containing protein [Erysipelotrichaceae bacterium]
MKMIYFPELDEFFKENSRSEAWHLEHPGQLSKRYDSLQYEMINGEKVYLFDFTDDMVGNDLLIFKESRFTILPAHKHRYLELNYVYSGSSKYTINGKKITLNKGDIVLLEPDVIHGAEYKSEDDIVVNFAMKERYYRNVLTKYNDNRHLLFDFLFDSLLKNRERNNYIVFRKRDNPMIDMVMQTIFYLYFGVREENYGSIMEEYIRLMFLQLVNETYRSNDTEFSSKDDIVLATIMKEIQDHYADCDLKKIAEQFGYNYNYFSNLIKKKTGYTFLELKRNRQLEEVKSLLISTDKPVDMIAQECGFTNLSYFYKVFTKNNGITPSEYRKRNI